jgi:hypothetical protein
MSGSSDGLEGLFYTNRTRVGCFAEVRVVNIAARIQASRVPARSWFPTTSWRPRATKILEGLETERMRIELRGVAGAVDVHRTRFNGGVGGD